MSNLHNLKAKEISNNNGGDHDIMNETFREYMTNLNVSMESGDNDEEEDEAQGPHNDGNFNYLLSSYGAEHDQEPNQPRQLHV